jgi:hypothetical protein
MFLFYAKCVCYFNLIYQEVDMRELSRNIYRFGLYIYIRRTSNDWMIDNNELERMWKGSIMLEKVLSSRFQCSGRKSKPVRL